MSLTAYNFQFYSYDMLTRRSPYCGNSMDVDDIDMSIPPPKPPRTFAMNNNNVPTTTTSQLSWKTSTPKRTIEPTTTAVTPTPAADNLAASNETPKIIYSGGLPKGVNTRTTESAKFQLQPKLHTTQKRWSAELREKVLEMSKYSSAESNKENIKPPNHWQTQGNEHALKLQPQHHIGRKNLSSEIREKALSMSGRCLGSLETPAKATLPGNYGINSHSNTINQRNSIGLQPPLVTATNNIVNRTCAEVNNIYGTCSRDCQRLDADDINSQTQNNMQTVKDRIRFFNKLTSSGSNTFINLLKNTKTTNRATIQHSSSVQHTPQNTLPKPRRFSTQLELNLQKDYSTPSKQLSQSQSQSPSNAANFFPSIICDNKEETLIAKTPPPSLSSSPATPFANTTYTSTQRKSTLRRRISVDKSRRPIVRQNSTASSNGTKPQMHSVMEDLSLVMPVKLRIAEYERRIRKNF